MPSFLPCVLLALGASVSAADESALPAQAQAVIGQMDHDISAAKARSVKTLRDLQTTLAKKGDSDAAQAIKRSADEIEAGLAVSARPRAAGTPAALANRAKTLVGVYITPGGSAVTLHTLFSTPRGGTYSSGIPGWSPEGSWSVVDETTVKMIRPDGSEWLFDIDGVTLRSRLDGVAWSRQQ